MTTVSDPIVQKVINKLVTRHEQGMIDYGVSLADNPAGVFFWIDNAIEESLDNANYLMRLKQELMEMGYEDKKSV